MEYIHNRRVVHRDIKPSNILITEHNYIKVADFGISKILYKNKDVLNTLIGTPLYLAPEVTTG